MINGFFKMRMTHVILFLIASCCLPSKSFSMAVEETRTDYHIQRYTDENGLPQNSVKAIMKDNNGFLWLSTEVGLVRLDGHGFTTFAKLLIPISSNRFTGFFPSLSKNNENSLYEFYAQTERNDYVGILANGLVSVDTSFFNNNLKFGVLGSPTGKPNLILPSLPSLNGVNPFKESYVTFAKNKAFYIWEKNRVSYYSHGRQIYQVEGFFKDIFFLGETPYAKTKGGNFVNIRSVGALSLTGDIAVNPGFSNWQKKSTLFWNNCSRQAFLYLNKCLYELYEAKSGGLTTKLILKDFDFDEHLISAAYYDAVSGSVFLGSFTEGLFIIKKKEFQTLRFTGNDADNVFYSQIPLANNSVLSAQGYNLKRDVKSFAVNVEKVSSLMADINYKFSLSMNRDSTFWMGVGRDLYKLSKTGKSFLNHLVLKENLKSYYVDRQDRLWIGSQDGALFMLNPTDTLPKLIARVAADGIDIIHQQSTDVFLLGSKKGLFRFNTRSKTLEEISNFKNVTLRSFYTTVDGTWITSYGDGFYLWTRDKIIHFPLDKDQFLATAHCIVEDSKGYFWITSNKGLFQVSKKQLLEYTTNNRHPVYYLYYDKSHGFESNEFNGGCSPCAVKLPSGVVSLPSINGLVWFSPDEIRPELPDRGIFISKIEVDGMQIPPKDNLELSRDFEQFRLYVTTPYFGHVNNIRMSYSIAASGENPRWIPLDDFVVRLSKMSSGKYNLVIRKVNGFGVNDYTYKTIQLSIAPAWYETWWFWGLLIFLLLTVVVITVRLRTRYLIRKEREDNLRRHFRVISQIVAAVNHDIQTPLHYVMYSLKQINSHLHKQSDSNQMITKMSDESLNTTLRISTLTKNLLDYIKLQNKNAAARTQRSHLGAFELVSDTCKMFLAIADTKNINIFNEVDHNLKIYSDPNLLAIVIHNFLDNALKISKSNVHISSSSLIHRKQIVIEDDGDGMPESLLIWLNKSYKSYEEWLRVSAYPEQDGIGLVIVKDLCVLLNIKIVATATGKGSVIRLVFTEKEESLRGFRD